MPLPLFPIWRGRKPDQAKLMVDVRRALKVGLTDKTRRISDRGGRDIVIDVAHVFDHIANSHDHMRWRLVPAIVPTLEMSGEAYESAAPSTPGNPKVRTYLATQPPRLEGEESLFVVKVKQRNQDWRFETIVQRKGDRDLRRTREPLKAEIRLRPFARSNPSYMGTRDPAREDRDAQRLSGAAPALTVKNGNPDDADSSIVTLGVIGLGLLACRALARKKAA